MSAHSTSSVWRGSFRIVEGVADKHGRNGFLLYGRGSEALVWDIEQSTASSSREWRVREGAWWIASSYRDTVLRLIDEHRMRTQIVPRRAPPGE